jgi:hypothetical protein
MLHLKKFIRGSLNMLADLVTVSRAMEKCPQYEHVQGSLEKSDPLPRLFFHRRRSTLNLAMMVDIRLPIVKSAAEYDVWVDDFMPIHSLGALESTSVTKFPETVLPATWPELTENATFKELAAIR